MNNTNKVICLMGPTCAGKTAAAIALTQCLPCDIISVDSAMIYRGMNIGTAKPTAAELAIAPHQLIDILDPAASYSVGQFQQDAMNCIQTVLQQGRIPLLVGGTMMYFRSLQTSLAKLPQADATIRQRLTVEAQNEGWPALHDRLKKIDPIAASRIHANDAQRLQRALEVYEITGIPLSEFLSQRTNEHNLQFINIGLLPKSREYLQQLIAERFVNMLASGFIDEVKTLKQRDDLHEDLPAIRCVGYRQVWQYLNNQISYDELVELGVIATRQLAKRQLTWLRPWPNLQWFDSTEPNISYKLQQILNTVEF